MGAHPGPGPRLRFGPFTFNYESRVLTRDGATVPLAPRTFDLLHVLATSDGRLLTKHELLARVWGDVNVEEASVAFQVSLLRKALGEHGTSWIETVPKHGYRFTAEVRHSETGASPPGNDAQATLMRLTAPPGGGVIA